MRHVQFKQISAFIVNHNDDICIDKKKICDMVALHIQIAHGNIALFFFIFSFYIENKVKKEINNHFSKKRHEYNWINRIVKCD